MTRKERDDYERRMAAQYAIGRSIRKYLRQCERKHGRIGEWVKQRLKEREEERCTKAKANPEI